MATVRKRGKEWYAIYKDEHEDWKEKSGFTDKSQTQKLAQKLEDEALARATGMADPDASRRAEATDIYNGSTRMICSEMVARAYSAAGVPITINQAWSNMIGYNTAILGYPLWPQTTRLDFTTPTMLSLSPDLQNLHHLWWQGICANGTQIATWSTDTGGWQTFTYNLSACKGQSITLKFSSWTADTVNPVNYFLDDINVLA
jgi:hypothetical protein